MSKIHYKINDEILCNKYLIGLNTANKEFVTCDKCNELLNKTDLITKLTEDMCNKNNTIDIGAYTRGLIDMYDELKKEGENE